MKKTFLIKTDTGYQTVYLDYFQNRLQRQTMLNHLQAKREFKKTKLTDCLNGYVKAVKRAHFDPNEVENLLLNADAKQRFFENYFLNPLKNLK